MLISVADAPTYAGFLTASSYPGGGGAMAVADFNRDGIPDIAATGPSGVTILLGTGNGTFQVAQTYYAGQEPEYSIAVGDFNGDGIPDLVVSNVVFDEGAPNTVTVLLGNGDGTFQPPQSYVAGSNPYAVAVGDFNGDGIPDLAVANNNPAAGPGNVSSTVSILLGNGDGSFQTPQSYAVAGPNAQVVVVGDFNKDGNLDLAVAHFQEPYGGSDMVTILLGNGDGTFYVASTLSYAGAEVDPYALVTADLNGDGHLDLILCSNKPVMISLGNGDGTFGAPIPTGVQAAGVAVGDFNDDGHLDLAVSGGGLVAVSLLLGNGDGTFQTNPINYAGSGPVVAADFNGDGRPDVAASVGPGVNIMLGNGDGTLRAARIFPFNDGGVSSAAVADFNRDGQLDVVVGGTIFLGNGDGTFQQLPYIPGAGGAVAVGNFNGDGIPDFASTFGGSFSSSPSTSIWLGNGDGTFQVAQSFNFGSGEPPAVGDFNGDGILDIAVDAPGAVMILLGNGDGTFQSPQNYPAQDGSLAVADFNLDGKLDIVTSGGSLLLGNGDGTFQTAQNLADAGGYSVAVGDFNGDGVADVALTYTTSSGGVVNVLLGNGDGTFQLPQSYVTGSSAGTVVVADVNQDGIADLAVASSQTVNVLLGIGDGTFQNAVSFSAGNNAYSLAVGDFNGDGFPDVGVVSGLIILLNDGHWGP